MDDVNNYLHYADIAFGNKRYADALAWYKKELDTDPDNTYALSRAGAICVSTGQFDLALDYFRRAKEIDTQNGDNYFNYANACFFKKDFAGAFASYVEAEKIGCSDDVMPRLFYQMALLCSLRQDTKSALVYFKKCEESDITGNLSLSPDLISEKLKLYMLIEDYSNAEKMAAQLLAIQPTLFRNYMVYYSILMAHKQFAIAERVLGDAKQYAEMTTDDRINLVLQTAALYVAEGEADPRWREANFRKAIELLESQSSAENITAAQRVNVLLTLSEVYQKAELHDKAVSCLCYLMGSTEKPDRKTAEEAHEISFSKLSPEEIDEMIRVDMERIQDLINTGELDGNLGAYSRVEYDESGYPVNVYDEETFAVLSSDPSKDAQNTPASSAVEKRLTLSPEQRERALFLLLTSYLAKDEFRLALKIADIMKHSNNKYYSYYGRYVSALATRKTGDDPTSATQKYAEAIAFFRNKMFADHSDSLAAIFRARLYAEEGKIEKAEEIAKLLAETDQKAVLDYIDSLAHA